MNDESRKAFEEYCTAPWLGSDSYGVWKAAAAWATQRERERCAKVCELQTEGFAMPSLWDSAVIACAKRIRAGTEEE